MGALKDSSGWEARTRGTGLAPLRKNERTKARLSLHQERKRERGVEGYLLMMVRMDI